MKDFVSSDFDDRSFEFDIAPVTVKIRRKPPKYPCALCNAKIMSRAQHMTNSICQSCEDKRRR